MSRRPVLNRRPPGSDRLGSSAVGPGRCGRWPLWDLPLGPCRVGAHADQPATSASVDSMQYPLDQEGRRRCGRLCPLQWPPLSAAQARTVRLLIERVAVGPDGADIRHRMAGLTSLMRELHGSENEAQRARRERRLAEPHCSRAARHPAPGRDGT